MMLTRNRPLPGGDAARWHVLPVARIHGQTGVDVYIGKVAETGVAA